jgi:DNA-binding NarL/FixJ family response regulator
MTPPNRAHAGALQLLLVDDHPALRAGLSSLLATQSDFEVQAGLANGEEAYAWYRSHAVDVVVMDISMAGYGGLEALRRIIHHDPRARILIYTVHDSEAMLSRVLSLGALGYVTKSSEIETLFKGIREVAKYRGFVSPDMMPLMMHSRAGVGGIQLEQLGAREFQIFLLVARGETIGSCAQSLKLSEKTVRNYLTQIGRAHV